MLTIFKNTKYFKYNQIFYCSCRLAYFFFTLIGCIKRLSIQDYPFTDISHSANNCLANADVWSGPIFYFYSRMYCLVMEKKVRLVSIDPREESTSRTTRHGFIFLHNGFVRRTV